MSNHNRKASISYHETAGGEGMVMAVGSLHPDVSARKKDLTNPDLIAKTKSDISDFSKHLDQLEINAAESGDISAIFGEKDAHEMEMFAEFEQAIKEAPEEELTSIPAEMTGDSPTDDAETDADPLDEDFAATDDLVPNDFSDVKIESPEDIAPTTDTLDMSDLPDMDFEAEFVSNSDGDGDREPSDNVEGVGQPTLDDDLVSLDDVDFDDLATEDPGPDADPLLVQDEIGGDTLETGDPDFDNWDEDTPEGTLDAETDDGDDLVLPSVTETVATEDPFASIDDGEQDFESAFEDMGQEKRQDRLVLTADDMADMDGDAESDMDIEGDLSGSEGDLSEDEEADLPPVTNEPMPLVNKGDILSLKGFEVKDPEGAPKPAFKLDNITIPEDGDEDTDLNHEDDLAYQSPIEDATMGGDASQIETDPGLEDDLPESFAPLDDETAAWNMETSDKILDLEEIAGLSDDAEEMFPHESGIDDGDFDIVDDPALGDNDVAAPVGAVREEDSAGGIHRLLNRTAGVGLVGADRVADPLTDQADDDLEDIFPVESVDRQGGGEEIWDGKSPFAGDGYDPIQDHDLLGEDDELPDEPDSFLQEDVDIDDIESAIFDLSGDDDDHMATGDVRAEMKDENMKLFGRKKVVTVEETVETDDIDLSADQDQIEDREAIDDEDIDDETVVVAPAKKKRSLMTSLAAGVAVIALFAGVGYVAAPQFGVNPNIIMSDMARNLGLSSSQQAGVPAPQTAPINVDFENQQGDTAGGLDDLRMNDSNDVLAITDTAPSSTTTIEIPSSETTVESGSLVTALSDAAGVNAPGPSVTVNVTAGSNGPATIGAGEAPVDDSPPLEVFPTVGEATVIIDDEPVASGEAPIIIDDTPDVNVTTTVVTAEPSDATVIRGDDVYHVEIETPGDDQVDYVEDADIVTYQDDPVVTVTNDRDAWSDGTDHAAGTLDAAMAVFLNDYPRRGEVRDLVSDFATASQVAALSDTLNTALDRLQHLDSIEASLAEAREQANRAEQLAVAQNEVLVKFVRLEDKMNIAERLIVDLSQRISTVETINPADRLEVERAISALNERVESMARDIGLIARVALKNENEAGAAAGTTVTITTGEAATPDAAVLIAPETVPTSPAASIDLDPSNIPNDVKKGDLVEGYGYVLDVMATSSGDRLVVMENGSAILN